VKWYFILQHVPPIELEPRTTHCAHPDCKYHQDHLMPAGAYRLNFTHKKLLGKPKYFLEEGEEDAGTPGRGEDGQMWFCLTCVQDLYNGVGLIQAAAKEDVAMDEDETMEDAETMEDETMTDVTAMTEDMTIEPDMAAAEGMTNAEDYSVKTQWRRPTGNIRTEWNARLKRAVASGLIRRSELSKYIEYTENPGLIPTVSSASRKHPAHTQETALPQPPNLKPMLMAPGLDVFAASLHTFIKPELRYTSNEFYTLNSYEYYAFMKWKNMCIRKSMWEIPINQEFFLQVPGVEDGYDFENFFGNDVLDNHETPPSIVAGIPLPLEPVSVEDISSLYVEQPSRQKSIGAYGDIISRTVLPLYDIMALVDERVRNYWAAMDPPFIPGQSGEVPDVLDRSWPLHSFWKSCFVKEFEELRQAELQKVIDKNYKVINARLKALGLKDLINYP
jgi:hypothetical protein